MGAARLLAGGLAAGSVPARAVRRTALDAVLRLPASGTVELFEAFGRLPACDQRAVFDPGAPTGALLQAFARQWWRMPVRGRAQLVAATAGWAPGRAAPRRHGARTSGQGR